MAKEKKEDMEIIDTKKRVTVYATAKAKHHKPGDEIVCGEKVAEDLVMKGLATDKKSQKA